MWLGPAEYRPYHDVYFPGPKWYRWWDFGSGPMSIEGVVALAHQIADALDRAGDGVPAVEKNVVRMRGALHVLQIQFEDLAAVTAASTTRGSRARPK